MRTLRDLDQCKTADEATTFAKLAVKSLTTYREAVDLVGHMTVLELAPTPDDQPCAQPDLDQEIAPDGVATQRTYRVRAKLVDLIVTRWKLRRRDLIFARAWNAAVEQCVTEAKAAGLDMPHQSKAWYRESLVYYATHGFFCQS